jgi:hypothetical protein
VTEDADGLIQFSGCSSGIVDLHEATGSCTALMKKEAETIGKRLWWLAYGSVIGLRHHPSRMCRGR